MRAFITLWPVRAMMGLPPCATMSSSRPCEHLTSKTIGAPGYLASTSRASSARIWSPHTMRPRSSTAPTRSASPS
jgi:hypothetical protein